MTGSPAIETVSIESAGNLAHGLAAVYNSAFGEDSTLFLDMYERHVGREGFRLVVARDADRIVGFAYGYQGSAGQWWHDMVRAAMTPEMAWEWMDGSFEVVELAVRQGRQGQGIGGALHDVLLQGVPNRTAVLSTQQRQSNALHLYRKRDWQVLLDNFLFPGGNQPWLIMGKRLRT